MKDIRMIGSTISKLSSESNLNESQLSEILNCSETDIKSVCKGRKMLSFNQLKILSEKFNVSVADILKGDESYYRSNVVHCMNNFSNQENREKILDIIDDYIDISEAINNND